MIRFTRLLWAYEEVDIITFKWVDKMIEVGRKSPKVNKGYQIQTLKHKPKNRTGSLLGNICFCRLKVENGYFHETAISN